MSAPTTAGWLRDDSGRLLSWDDVAQRFPEPVAALVDLHRAVWDDTDPVLLELCRLRLASLLSFDPGLRLRSPKARAAGLTEEKVAQLAQWPASPLFDERERACLSLAEQMLIHVAGTTDEQVEDVLRFLEPAACYRLVQGISAMESLDRLVLVLGLPDSLERAWLDEAPAPIDAVTGGIA